MLALLNSLQLAMYDPFDTPALRPDTGSILSGKAWPPFARGLQLDLSKAFSIAFLCESTGQILARGLVCLRALA